MKVTIRIPTVQFGYVEIETEANSQLEAIEIHNKLIELYKESVKVINNNDDF